MGGLWSDSLSKFPITTTTEFKPLGVGAYIGSQLAPMEGYNPTDHQVSHCTNNVVQQSSKLNDRDEIKNNQDADQDEDEDCIFVRSENFWMPGGNHKESPICVDDYDDENDELRIMYVKPSPINPKRRKLSNQAAESSDSKSGIKAQVTIVDIASDGVDFFSRRFTCEICADSKPLFESFKIKRCSHSYCSECVKTYVGSKLQDGVSEINCPVMTCEGVLDPDYCKDILSSEAFDRWGLLLCESVIPPSEKLYCPFKDCSALMIDDGGEKLTVSECPSCCRLFCAQCKVAWHDGVECAQYKKLRKDENVKEDNMLMNLADSRKSQRCP